VLGIPKARVPSHLLRERMPEKVRIYAARDPGAFRDLPDKLPESLR
jgi:hypothetical protein